MREIINHLLSRRDRIERIARLVEHLGVKQGLLAVWREAKAGVIERLRAKARPPEVAPEAPAAVDGDSASPTEAPLPAATPPVAEPQPQPYEAFRHTLTSALVELAAHHGVAADPAGLAAALPRIDGDIDPRAAPISLARIGLHASWRLTTLAAIEDLHMPAALELSGGGYLLVERRIGETALEVRAGTQRLALPLTHLAHVVSGRMLVLGVADPINGARDADDRAAIAKGPRRWILMRFLQDRKLISQLVLASVILNVCSLAMPLFQRAIYDRVIPNLALDSLWALSIGIVIALAFEFALRGARHDFIESQGLRVAQQVQTRIMSSVLSSRLDKAPRNSGAALVALRDIEGLALLAPAAIATFFVDLPFFIVFLGAIALMAGPIALCVVAGAAALVIIGLASLAGAGPASARNIQLSRARNSMIVDVVDGLSTIKANQAEGKFVRNWATLCDHLAMSGHDVRRSNEVSTAASSAVIQAVTIASIIVGVLMVKAGDLTAGALIGATLLASRAMAPISSAVGLTTRAYQSLGQFKAMAELLALPPEREDPRASVAHAPRMGGFDLRRVSVTYDGAHDPALQDLSIRIEPGEKVAIIGRSGSGKTTLLQVLAGLVAPSSGSVLVDGHNLQHFRMETIRAGLAYAAQDASLFDAPLRDNLTLGVATLDGAALEQAIRFAGVDKLAQTLPDGFSTAVGPRGSRLSGGQRQAVILARAFARRAPVLLLDEPTSAMDIQTEQQVIAGIRAAAEGATLVLATHRIELLSLVDRVLWLENGRLVADQPRDEVIAAIAARSGGARKSAHV